LYSWGSNLFNRLGVNALKISKSSPTQENRSTAEFKEDNKKN
jgi:alpha-tubulin suppressor-like RCC1 family protein